MNPRIILNMLKWKEEFDFSIVKIFYIHRGADDNTKIIFGKDVQNLGKSFIQTRRSMIPYHRVFKIIYDNKIFFDRQQK